MHFGDRCHAGASDTFKGTTIHRLVENLGMFGGHHKGCALVFMVLSTPWACPFIYLVVCDSFMGIRKCYQMPACCDSHPVAPA